MFLEKRQGDQVYKPILHLQTRKQSYGRDLTGNLFSTVFLITLAAAIKILREHATSSLQINRISRFTH